MASQFKILLTISEFMYSSQVRNLCDLADGLDREIFDVEIGALATGNEATAEIERLDLPYFRLRLCIEREMNSTKLLDLVKGPLAIMSSRYDLVHSLLWQSHFSEPLITRSFSRAKYVYTKSNIQWDNHPVNWKLKSLLSNKIISISRATDHLLNMRGLGHKIQRIHLGIDTDRFVESVSDRIAMRQQLNVPTGHILFGCAAQYIPMKNHIMLIEAFDHLCKNNDRIHLCFCGPNHGDDYYRRVMDRIDHSLNRKSIHVLGTLNNMAAFYSGIDCFVLPSSNEPFGYVYIEAMSCSRPVIACRAGGPIDIVVDGQTGWLCELDSLSDLQRKMAQYIDHPQLLRQHGAAARARAIDLFSTQKMVEAHQRLYLSLIDKKSH